MKTKGDFMDKSCTLEQLSEGLPSLYVTSGGELSLSNSGQLELLLGMTEFGASLRTMVRGYSMYPFIRDRDILTIVPMNSRGPKVGDVVAFIRPNTRRLTIHRVVRQTDNGWLLKGDNCSTPDGFVLQKQIIGCVTRLEHNGREVRLGLGIERKWVALLSRGNWLLRFKELLQIPRRAASFTLRCLQNIPLYRLIGRHFTQATVQLSEQSEMKATRRWANPPPITYPKQPAIPKATNWVARKGRKMVGFVQLVYHPAANYPWAGYWLFSLHVRKPFRGFGIGEKLTAHLIHVAKKQGAKELFLTVFEDNIPAISLYSKLGFATVTSPSPEMLFVKEKERKGPRRIIMQKSLEEDV